MLPKICAIPECGREVRGAGYCNRHYLRLKRHGDPLAGGVPNMAGASLPERFWAKVLRTDDPSECWGWSGSHTSAGYANLNLGSGKYGYAHRVSYELHHGPIPDGLDIDHACRNRGCLNPDHLRAATRKQNNENLSVASPSNKTSGTRGVSYDKSTRSWMTYAGHNGRRVYGPRFSTRQEAAESVRQLRLSLFTHNDADRKTNVL